MLKHFAERSNVWLGTLADEPIEQETVEVLESLTEHLSIESVGRSRWLRAAISLIKGRSATEGLFCSPKLRQSIRRWSRETRFDAVVVFCSSMAQYASIPELRDVPLVVDLVDVDSQKFFDYGALSRGLKRGLYHIEGRRLRSLECSLAKRAEAIALVSEREAELYRSFCPNERTIAVPNGVDLEYFRPEDSGPKPWKPLLSSERTNLVFVGALDYQANIDGITWFANTVWPLVRRELPELTLGLVGRNPSRAVEALAAIAGIRVYANVPDVRPYLAAADAAIAPLRIARGVQNKVLEAMAMGKPMICSIAALEGIEATPGRDVWVCDSPESYTRAIRMVVQEPREQEKLGEQAREYVVEHHAWSACLAKMHSAPCLSWQSPQNSAAEHPCFALH
jgi:polysaccharide biosynthesis protein PslH